MFDRSSSQPPSDSGHIPPFPSLCPYIDPNDPNQPGFYKENPQFYQNYHQTYNQNYSQNYSQNQGSPYQPPQTNSQYFKQFSNIQPQTAQNLHHGAEYNVYSNYHPTQNGGQLYMDPNGQQSDRLNQQNMKTENEETTPNGPTTVPGKKKRGRPSKKTPDSAEVSDEQEVQKKKRNLNRFDGLSVEEVMSRTLPDVIEENLDILIIGINPGLLSAYKGHHYPNPGNHFWKCLFLSGLTDKQLNFLDDTSLPQKHGIGFTNMVERTTPGSKDLSSKEIREGGKQLLEKLQKYRPLIAAFNGKGIYEIFCKETFGVKAKNLEFGLQPYKIPQTETVCFLMPSSSPRCAQFPRAQDKVHFYIKLKELRDGLKGAVQSREVEETHYTFDLQLAKEDARLLAIKEEQVDPEYESYARDLSEPNTDTKR
ncbi:G/T mismatch-specific thymine DNA glycosylase isoform X2 [Periophthalmus magnuspinnatus]|uniref:G/T mismatch-specific thymine DNA glycosylase isoform X2 n=1 Tax=Periophthalmus magnuspinnatus TaxID=409849 RepID=UPI0024364D78|nr:G/T mismatch-specific thymine DNA glycosylase isoform X2 [Periophthalmus magnuspinnatus]